MPVEIVAIPVVSKYAEPGKPFRATVQRLDTVKITARLINEYRNVVNLTGCTVLVAATDTTKTVLYNVTIDDAANGLIEFVVQPDVVGRYALTAKVTSGNNDETTFFLGAVTVAVEDKDVGSVDTISSLTQELETDISSLSLMAGRVHRSTTYVLNDIVAAPTLKSWLYLECTTAGTTALLEPDFSSYAVNDTVVDGTVTWTVQDRRIIKATSAEIIAGTNTDKLLTPATLTGAKNVANGYAGLNSEGKLTQDTLGNSATATKANQDNNGDAIADTYLRKDAKAVSGDLDAGTNDAKYITPSALRGATDFVVITGFARTGDNTFTLAGDVAADYPAGKLLRWNDSDTYLCRVYGTPTVANSVTTVTVWMQDQTQVIPASPTKLERSRLSPVATANKGSMSGTATAAVIATLQASYCCGDYWTKG